MLRDDRFQSPYEPEDDSLWLPAQMLHAMSSMLSQSDDTQTDMLKVSLNLTLFLNPAAFFTLFLTHFSIANKFLKSEEKIR